ncbi:MAG: response regulator [Hyphomonadaceae bacterium]|nr:response regulator [Hyphomonadaceae bacterium]
MIVDDDAGLLAALRFAFETEGMMVESYLSAEAALAAPAMAHDCVVLDQRLPGLSGLDLLERLRSRGETAPALLITSNPVATTRARAMAAGVEIVEKPLLQDVLTHRVRQLI